ncbi:MAG: hypothetical protein KGI80_05060 [Verrucomicrobiota bacterium]|nr:hypothetical protein [Verrucomicrobiota bacterium]
MSEHQQPIEYKNSFVESVVLFHPHCRVEFRVKALSPLLAKARGEATKEVRKAVTFPGFRKGKAPEAIVSKNYPNEIAEELPSALARLSFNTTEEMAKVPALNNRPKITYDLKTIGAEEAELSLFFETEPTIPEIDPKLFVRKEAAHPPATEEQVDELLLQTRYFFADWKEVEDRPIQEGDLITINLDVVKGEALEPVFEDVRLEVSKKRMADWMFQLVLGKKSGDLVEGLSEPDANLSEEERAQFEPKKVRVQILTVNEAILPPCDDAFAERLGAKDVAEMRASMEKDLNRRLDEDHKEKLRKEVNLFLLETYPFEVPSSLVEAEREHRLKQAMAESDWEEKSAEEKENAKQKLAEASLSSVRLFYLSRQIVRQGDLPLTHEEVQNRAVILARRERAEVAVDQIPQEMYAFAFSQLMLAKAQDFVLEKSA